jgi:GntR family transcriptional regulator / MocR family aminotransferase
MLYREIYESIRSRILDGQFRSGLRIPSTRQMAKQFGVSRNTITTAYDQLIAEGYLEAQTGSGTYVSEKLPDEFVFANVENRAQSKARPSKRRLSKRGTAIAAIRLNWQKTQAPVRPFTPCVPSVAEFPFQIWHRLVSRRLKTPVRSLWNYSDPAGYKPLREAIAAHLGASRGVRCHQEQVIVVSGIQQAMDLAARILLDPGDSVCVEDPGYLGTRGALIAANARIVPVPVDENGMRVQIAEARASRAKLISVTPSNQYPLGVTLSLARRLQLLEFAEKSGAWIFEDDYDSEFRYETRPLAALQGLDSSGRVIYAGTFSKVLNPALRLGYLIVPEDLIDAFIRTKAVLDRHSPLLEQMILADFLIENHFVRHIRRMRNIYGEKREVLISALQSELNGAIEIGTSNAGLHLTMMVKQNDLKLAAAAAAEGIESEPLSAFYIKQRPIRGLALGYAPFSNREIREGVSKLARLIR